MGFLKSQASRLLKSFGRIGKSLSGASTVFFQGPKNLWDMLRGSRARYGASYWLRKFNECSILQRPVRRLMEDFASVVITLKRKVRGPNGRTKLIDVFDHPIIKILLEKPNPHMTSEQYFEMWEQMATLTGEFLSYIEFDSSGYPQAIYPIATDKIKERPDPAKNRNTWKFYGPKNKEITVGPESIMYYKLLNGANIYGEGVGLCVGITRDIEMYEAATDWSLNFFKQGSHVGAIVHIPDLDEGEDKKLQEHWQKNHTGSGNAHKTLFVSTTGGEGGANVSVHKMGSAHRDLDYSQGIIDIKDRVRENFNIPAELIGDSKSSNRAASLASENFHQKNNIRPRAKRAVAFLNCFFVPLFGDSELVLVFEDPVQEDKMIKHKALMDGLKWGCINQDQWLESRGYDPRGDAVSQAYAIPLNVTLIDGEGKVVHGPPPKEGRDEEKPPEPDGDQAEQVEKQASDILRKVAFSLEALNAKTPDN